MSVVKKKHPPVIAKAKRRKEIEELFDPKSQKKAEREITAALAELDEATDERYEYAQALLEDQDDAVHRAVKQMVETMHRMAGPPRFVYKGIAWGEPAQLARMQEKSFTWIAVRIIAACAEWDIRIGKFKAPKRKCVKCGKRVKK